jgi:hypothetical protein
VKYLASIEKLIGEDINWYDGDLSTLPVSTEADEAPRRGRGSRDKPAPKRRPRNEGRERERPQSEIDIIAAAAEAKEVEVAPVDDQPVVRVPEKPHRAAIKADNEQRRARPAPAPHGEQPRRDHRRDRDDMGAAPIGFGDEIPAFMLIDTKI